MADGDRMCVESRLALEAAHFLVPREAVEEKSNLWERKKALEGETLRQHGEHRKSVIKYWKSKRVEQERIEQDRAAGGPLVLLEIPA